MFNLSFLTSYVYNTTASSSSIKKDDKQDTKPNDDKKQPKVTLNLNDDGQTENRLHKKPSTGKVVDGNQMGDQQLHGKRKGTSTDETIAKKLKVMDEPVIDKGPPKTKNQLELLMRKAYMNRNVVKTLSCEKLPWVELYRPKTLTTFYDNKRQIENIKNFFNRHRNKDPQGKLALILVGPTGSGKTTLGRIVASSLGYDICEFNSTSYEEAYSEKDEKYNIIKDAVLPTLARKPFAGIPHMVLLDELDGLSDPTKSIELLYHRDDDIAGSGILQRPKGYATYTNRKTEIIDGIEVFSNEVNNSWPAPLVITVNDYYSKSLSGLRKACLEEAAYDDKRKIFEVVWIERPDGVNLRKILGGILAAENIGNNPTAITEIIAASKRDVRRAIMLLEESCRRLDGRTLSFEYTMKTCLLFSSTSENYINKSIIHAKDERKRWLNGEIDWESIGDGKLLHEDPSLEKPSPGEKSWIAVGDGGLIGADFPLDVPIANKKTPEILEEIFTRNHDIGYLEATLNEYSSHYLDSAMRYHSINNANHITVDHPLLYEKVYDTEEDCGSSMSEKDRSQPVVLKDKVTGKPVVTITRPKDKPSVVIQKDKPQRDRKGESEINCASAITNERSIADLYEKCYELTEHKYRHMYIVPGLLSRHPDDKTYFTRLDINEVSKIDREENPSSMKQMKLLKKSQKELQRILRCSDMDIFIYNKIFEYISVHWGDIDFLSLTPSPEECCKYSPWEVSQAIPVAFDKMSPIEQNNKHLRDVKQENRIKDIYGKRQTDMFQELQELQKIPTNKRDEGMVERIIFLEDKLRVSESTLLLLDRLNEV